VRRKGFTLLEILIVISIIVLLMSILLPCLMRAKESAYELFAIQREVDEEGKVLLEIKDPSDRKPYEDIFREPLKTHFYCERLQSSPAALSGQTSSST